MTSDTYHGDGKNYGHPCQEAEESPAKRRLLDEGGAVAVAGQPEPRNSKGKYPAERQLGNGNKQCNNASVAHEATRVLREWRQRGAKGDPPLMLALDSSTTQTGFAFLAADIPADCIQLVTNDADDAKAIRRHRVLGSRVTEGDVTAVLDSLGPHTLGVAFLDYCETPHATAVNDVFPLLYRDLLVPGGALAFTYCKRGCRQDGGKLVEAILRVAQPRQFRLKQRNAYDASMVFLLFVEDYEPVPERVPRKRVRPAHVSGHVSLQTEPGCLPWLAIDKTGHVLLFKLASAFNLSDRTCAATNAVWVNELDPSGEAQHLVRKTFEMVKAKALTINQCDRAIVKTQWFAQSEQLETARQLYNNTCAAIRAFSFAPVPPSDE